MDGNPSFWLLFGLITGAAISSAAFAALIRKDVSQIRLLLERQVKDRNAV